MKIPSSLSKAKAKLKQHNNFLKLASWRADEGLKGAAYFNF
ncbi:MAG: hypothetical protein AAGI07_01990 [Bacteroidota bacterium]